MCGAKILERDLFIRQKRPNNIGTPYLSVIDTADTPDKVVNVWREDTGQVSLKPQDLNPKV